jgi:hypothetical protein
MSPTIINVDSLPFVEARWKTPTNGRGILWVVLHDMEAPEQPTTAEDTAQFFHTTPRAASSHICVDNNSAVQCVKDKDIAYGAPGANAAGLHVEQAGYASQSREDWLDAYSSAEIDITAGVTAWWCGKYGLPVRFVDAAGLLRQSKGITTHAEVTHAFGGNNAGHYDPGPNFPMDYFLSRVNIALGRAPKPEDDDVPKPTDVVDALENQWGRWQLTADGGVRTKKGKFYGSYPGLPPDRRLGTRYFLTISNRGDGREGYMLTANDGNEYNFP